MYRGVAVEALGLHGDAVSSVRTPDANYSLTSNHMDNEFPELVRPPIIEVVCAILFQPTALDGMDLGVYWEKRRTDYPSKSLQPALLDGGDFILGNPAMRAVLASQNSVRMLQLQHDRFLMNWRALGEDYPRFSTRSDRGPGLLDLALEEFRQFSEFVAERIGTPVKPLKVELVKVDDIVQGKHWSDRHDLTKLIPLTGTFDEVHQTGNREFRLQFIEHDEQGRLVIALQSILDKPGGDVRAARLETRAIRDVSLGTDARECFLGANGSANRVFFTLVSKDELHRFGNSGGTQ